MDESAENAPTTTAMVNKDILILVESDKAKKRPSSTEENGEGEEQASPMNEAEQEDEEEDDDDFGAFEEAPHAEQPEVKEKRPTEEFEEISKRRGEIHSCQQQPPSPSPLFYMSIARLIEVADLWECPAEQTHHQGPSAAAMDFATTARPTPPNLFAQLDAGSNADTGQLQDDNAPLMLKAYRLWCQICYVEEAHALQLRWEHSRTCQRQRWALQLQKRVNKNE